jgi:hypothetical protein
MESHAQAFTGKEDKAKDRTKKSNVKKSLVSENNIRKE